MKKLINVVSVLLTVAFLISCSGFVFAKGGEKAGVVITSEKSGALPGEVVHFTVKASSNYYSLAMRWLLLFPKDVFELYGYEGNFASSAYFDDLEGTMLANMTGENVPYPEDYSSSEYSAIVAQWTGGGENAVCFKSDEYVEMFSFDLKVRDNAPAGVSASVFIPESWNGFYNLALENRNDPTTFYKASDIEYTFAGKSILVKSGAFPEIVPCEGSKLVVDDEHHLLWGFTEGIYSAEDIEKYLRVTDAGSVELKETDMGFGTGSEAEVYDCDGNLVSKYELVVFGDATGDGVTDETDAVMTDLVNSYIIDAPSGTALHKSLDLNGDEVINEEDFVIMDLINSFLGEMDQATGEYVVY